jgi:hypothetical protein
VGGVDAEAAGAYRLSVIDWSATHRTVVGIALLMTVTGCATFRWPSSGSALDALLDKFEEADTRDGSYCSNLSLDFAPDDFAAVSQRLVTRFGPPTSLVEIAPGLAVLFWDRQRTVIVILPGYAFVMANDRLALERVRDQERRLQNTNLARRPRQFSSP